MCAFIERAPHLGIHLPHRRGKETGDHPASTPPRAAARWLSEDTLEALVARHLPGRTVTLEDIAFLEEIFGKLVSPA